MKVDFYTLTEETLRKMSGELPEYVIKRAEQQGCFTLGAAVKNGEERGILIGMCQFLVNKVTDTEIVAELAYIYVYEEYRREGVGLMLLDKMSSILKNSDIKRSLTILVSEEAESLGYEFSENDLEEFLREGDYMPTNEASESWDMAERRLFAGIPDILITSRKKYVRRMV